MKGSIGQAALDELLRGFKGEVLLPDDPAYAEGRKIFNAMIDRRPAVIARCAEAADVSRAVRFGQDAGLEIAVRGGGHHVAGWSLTDGGLVIDLSRLNAVEVDPRASIARVQGGATLGDLARACQPHGLATTGGTCPGTGVAGLTLGGGWGYLARKFGLAADNLLSIRLTTADGNTVVASDDEHQDLFWALHGGGGNFGIATEFTFRLHPLADATMATLVFSLEAGPEVVARFRRLFEEGPDELCGELVYMACPAEDSFPSHLVGKLCLHVGTVYVGPESGARKAIEPLLKAGPEAQMIAAMPYTDILNAGDIGPRYRHCCSSEHMITLSDGAIERFCARAGDANVGPGWLQALASWGGRIARHAGDWPIADRDAAWMVYSFPMWDDPEEDERYIGLAKALRADMTPYATGNPYLNLIADEGKERMVAGYGGETKYRRLVKIKNEYDPDNILHLNHNIKPL